MSNEIKLVLVDDHAIILDALSDMLNNEQDIKIVGKAQEPKKLFNLLSNKEVDVVLLDVEMPTMGGLEILEKIQESHPKIKVLMLTQHNKRAFISHAIQKGANGYMLKSADKHTLINGIHAVMQGELFTGGIKLNNVQKANEQPSLSDREIEIIHQIVKEKTSMEIAHSLSLSPNTVNQHRKNIMAKLNVKSVVGIVKYAIENGIISED